MTYNSTFTIDLNIIAQNARNTASKLGGTAIIPVLKGNAYGHGLERIYETLRRAIEFPYVAVAHASEAARIRASEHSLGNTGRAAPGIMLVSGVPLNAVVDAVSLGAVIPLGDVTTAEAVAYAADKPVDVQVELDCGMHRYGAQPGAALQVLISAVRAQPRLNVVGAYAHLSILDHVDEVTVAKELDVYREGLAQLEEAGIRVPFRHVASSNVSEWCPEAYFDAVRLGRRLYIGPPAGGAADDGSVTEAGTWSSVVAAVHSFRRGESYGYGGAYTAERDSRIAIVSIGREDGLQSALCAVGAPALVRGERGRLVGANMDSCYIDVTESGANVGDEVIFFGKSSDGAVITARELAACIGDEGVFLTSKLTSRVGRNYLSDFTN